MPKIVKEDIEKIYLTAMAYMSRESGMDTEEVFLNASPAALETLCHFMIAHGYKAALDKMNESFNVND